MLIAQKKCLDAINAMLRTSALKGVLFVNEQWKIEIEQWKTDIEQWKTINEQWKTVNEQQKTDFGQWKTDLGN